MLPKLVRHAKYAFRHMRRSQDYHDMIQETIANAFVAFKALVRRGKMDLAYPTVLARYAVAQIADGRRVGSSLNCQDILSPYAQRLKCLTVERLDRREADDEEQWKEAIVEDTRTPVPDQVIVRCAYPAWLDSLKRRDRRMAEYLSLGNRTSDAARKFKVSAGRVSQIRKELARSWAAFTDFNEGNAA
jgi:DNA-directed RNA polymerase specialized sigma24 family protein